MISSFCHIFALNARRKMERVTVRLSSDPVETTAAGAETSSEVTPIATDDKRILHPSVTV